MVRKLLTFIFTLVIAPLAIAQISLEVYEADGITPFDCNDEIMVGTKLSIIVSSDSNDYWSGGLFIAGQDRALGTLAGRGLDSNDPNARDYAGSHYEDAGNFARVTAWNDSSIWGFDLYTFYPVDGNSDSNSTVAGDWFVIDYYADEVGDCNVGFYDYNISWDDPNYYIVFSHVPTRDLNSDKKVNFGDFAIFASQWDAVGCNEPNWCEGADLDFDGYVDCYDLRLFIEYWLWVASGNDPNDPNYPEGQSSQQMMGSGTGEMLDTQESQQTQSTQELNIDELVSWLEEIWIEGEQIRETFSEAEWQEFIDSVKNSDQ